MSDLPPPSPWLPRRGPRPKRPLYLSIALLLVWLVALGGASEGFRTIEELRHPEAVRSSIEDGPLPQARIGEARIDAVLAQRGTVIPLAVAELLLGTMLATMAGLTLLGRRRARSLLFQATAAYAVLLPLDFTLRRPIRAAMIEALATDPMVAPAAELTTEGLRVFFWWVSRGALAAQLVILALGVFATTRPRARRFFMTFGAEDPEGEGS